MPRDGAGNYNLPSSEPVFLGTVISSSAHNTTESDIASALTQSISKDGQTVPTANLPMGGFKFTNLGTGTATGDSVNKGQMDAAISSGSGNALLRDGSNSPTANLSMGGFKHTNAADGSSAQDYSTVNQTLLRNGTNAATADIPFGSHKITGLTNGTNPGDAVNKGQLDVSTAASLHLDGSNSPTTDISFASHKITSLANGTSATDAINKGQLDAQTFGSFSAYIDVTASRALGVTYTNTSGKLKAVSINVSDAAISATTLFIDGLFIVGIPHGAGLSSIAYAIVPPGSTYSTLLTGSNTLNAWFEST